jgi:choline dehydrogenase-like flavoprotein
MALTPRAARSQTKARVVVIGGGVGGATVAKYLAMMAGTIEVTLVEPKPRYTTCFFSIPSGRDTHLESLRTAGSAQQRDQYHP